MAKRKGYRPRHLLVKDFTTILFAHDLMGLTGLGCPTDEYESEALSIVARMTETQMLDAASGASAEDALAVTLHIIRDVFELWFGTIVDGAKALDLARVLLAEHVASYPASKKKTAPVADTSPESGV